MQPGTGYNLAQSGREYVLDVERPWPADIDDFQGNSLVVELYKPHPFRIVKTFGSSGLGGFFYNLVPDAGSIFAVEPGTVNGTTCFLGPTSCGAALTNVYVQTYPDASIQIIATTSTLTDSDSAAYVLIGQVDQYDKKQYVRGNLLRERVVLGMAPAYYNHSSDDIL